MFMILVFVVLVFLLLHLLVLLLLPVLLMLMMTLRQGPVLLSQFGWIGIGDEARGQDPQIVVPLSEICLWFSIK